jgi:tagatose 6-phosphate kinase
LIVTVTLNPALQVEYAADQIMPGATNRVRRVGYRASGRGLAVARVLHTFGHEVVAAGLAGGSASDLIRAELARAGVATQFTPIAAESRRTVVVTDGLARQATSFAEPAPYVTTEELGRLARDGPAGRRDRGSALQQPAGQPAGRDLRLLCQLCH